MAKKGGKTADRKKEHIEYCLTDDVSFKSKTTGFEFYEFEHYAITEVDIDKINFKTEFLRKKIDYPFLISCMTGGTSKAGNINAKLSIAANDLNIPLGVGSQRQALENDKYLDTYKIIRKNAPNIPILGNLGAPQLVKIKPVDKVQALVDMIEADAMVIHLNPLQELFQENGQPNFVGLLHRLEMLVKKINVPVIVKEVGSGISRKAAQKLIDAGVAGIDVAGAGGTSWAGVEMLRTSNDKYPEFWDWGIPTAYCLRQIAQIREYRNFYLIGSGGINSGMDVAKAFALGADLVASARIILQTLDKSDVEGVRDLVIHWFNVVRKVMFLTGSFNLTELKNKNNLIYKDELY